METTNEKQTLKYWRAEKGGWSQADLAERAGISPRTVGSIERGEVLAGAGTMYKLALALGVKVVQIDWEETRANGEEKES